MNVNYSYPSNCNTIRKLFSDSSSWTQGNFAKTWERIPCNVNDSTAYCFCLEGAIKFVYPKSEQSRITEALGRAACDMVREGLIPLEYAFLKSYCHIAPSDITQADHKGVSLVRINDLCGYETVMELVKRVGV